MVYDRVDELEVNDWKEGIVFVSGSVGLDLPWELCSAAFFSNASDIFPMVRIPV
jgi:hypothetical protein